MFRSGGTRGNALLMEIMLVVLFFALSATVILQIFATARSGSEQAGQLNEALLCAQEWAERLYASEEPEKMLEQAGFEAESGEFRLETDRSPTVLIAIDREQKGAGVLMRATVSAASDEGLVELPLSRYLQGEGDI